MKFLALWGVGALAAVSSSAQAQSIDWEIVHRFRVFKNETVTNRYIGQLQAIARGGTYAPLIAQDTGKLGSAVNFSTQWDEQHEQYDIAWVHDPVRKIRLTVSGAPAGAQCSWTRDGVRMDGSRCGERDDVSVPVGGSAKLAVTVTRNGVVLKNLETVVAPKDVFIAVVGDSYVSGESNPHLKLVRPSTDTGPLAYPAIWWDTRCHRSMVSGATQASALLAERNTKQSVTFVSYACSGAEIKDGVLTEFEGRETINQIKALWGAAGQPPGAVPALMLPGAAGAFKLASNKLKSQIERLRDLLCPPAPGSHWTPRADCAAGAKRIPDIVLISIGGNDIGFGEIGRELLLSNPENKTPAGIRKWREQHQEKLKARFDALADDYAALASDVRTRIDPRRVMLMEYLDPTMYSTRRDRDFFCGETQGRDGGRFGRFTKELKRLDAKDGNRLSYPLNSSLYNILMTRGEGRFAQWVVHELNGRVRAAASGQKWNAQGSAARVIPLQDMKGADGLRRGLCARNSWFTGIVESFLRQDWIPADDAHTYPLKLNAGECNYDLKDGKCLVPAGNVTSGILHPNFFGHYNAGRTILLQMEAALKE